MGEDPNAEGGETSGPPHKLGREKRAFRTLRGINEGPSG